jgi:hypothetical protein
MEGSRDQVDKHRGGDRIGNGRPAGAAAQPLEVEHEVRQIVTDLDRRRAQAQHRRGHRSDQGANHQDLIKRHLPSWPALLQG